MIMADALNWNELLAKIEGSDEVVRHLSVERLVEYPAEKTVPVLLGRLGDSSWRLRKRAVELLVDLSDQPGIVELLVESLSDEENPGRRNAAVEALVQCGEKALAPLLETTHSEDRDVRKFAVDILARIGGEAMLPRLVALLDEADPNVQGASADALGMIGFGSAVPDLVRVAGDARANHLVRFSALCALSRLDAAVSATALGNTFDDKLLRPAAFAVLDCEEDAASVELLLKGLIAHERSSREAAMDALLRTMGALDLDAAEVLSRRIGELARSSSEVASDCIERLANADITTQLTLIPFLGVLAVHEGVLPILEVGRDGALQELAIETLHGMGDLAESVIIAEWEMLDAELRGLACELFGKSQGETTALRLTQTLSDPDVEIRAAAIRALGQRQEEEAFAPLLRRMDIASQEDQLEQDIELESIRDALLALIRSKEDDQGFVEGAIELLHERYRDAVENVRLAVAQILRRIVAPRDAAVVMHLLKDPSSWVRREAVKALARVGLGETAESLRLALADESPMVRVAAAEALGSGGFCTSMGDLHHLAADEDMQVRAAALRAMGRSASSGRCGPDCLETALAQLEAGLEEEGPVAMAALEALRSIGGTAVVELAKRSFENRDPDLVQAGLRCVGEHGAEEDLRALVPFLEHANWAVRAEVIEVLTERGAGYALEGIRSLLEDEEDAYVRDAASQAVERLEAD